MLFEAVFWDSSKARPTPVEFEKNPNFRKLLKDWGRAGDTAVIALIDGQPVGAAWYRFWTSAEHSYGFVDEQTPELAIGVRAAQRGQGIGRKLLRALLEQARHQGLKEISLSVEPENLSLWLYKTEGFVKISEFGNAWTMVKKL
jgi:ribosomal protein S18 acetylase RimI-like enzyme